jgi:hypothetical protein
MRMLMLMPMRRTLPTAQWVAKAELWPLFRLEEALDQV